ncbi:MAG: helix-turn-helix domain-containing protein [Longimicrobiales bacterium]
MSPRSSRRDGKTDALRAHGALHPHSQKVRDPLFGLHEFFDARDLVQVKYEMVRRVEVDGHSVAQTTDAFGCSRPTFYHAQTAFKAQGLPGLVPRKRGPRGAHKLDDAVMAFVSAQRTDDPTLSTPALLSQIRRRFGLAVHRRTLERAWRREEKKRR